MYTRPDCQHAETNQQWPERRHPPSDIQRPRNPAWAAQEQDLADLHAQMLEFAALIQTLAEQNTQLVQRVESLRVRVRVLGVVVVLLVVGVGWLAVLR